MEVAFAWRSSLGVFVDSFQMTRAYTIEAGECDVLLTGAEMVHAYISVRRHSFFGLFSHDVPTDAVSYRANDAMVTPANATMCVGSTSRQGSVAQLGYCRDGEEPRLFNIWVNADSYNPVELILR